MAASQRAQARLTSDVQTSRIAVMEGPRARCQPGRVRDAIIQVLAIADRPLHVRDIEADVSHLIGPTSSSSIRSYLRLNTPEVFVREAYGSYRLARKQGRLFPEAETGPAQWREAARLGDSVLYHADCFDWLKSCPDLSLHAVVTDPPYGLFEYTPEQQSKLRRGKGGVWRIPPSFDGHVRSPLPRFTTLTQDQLEQIGAFFFLWARLLLPKIVPGAHVIVASNPLLSYIVSGALAEAGLERRGEIIRLTMTMRGGGPAQTRASGIFRDQRHAPLDVGAVGGFPQADRRPGPG